MKSWMKSFFLTKKYVKVKIFESDKPREKYQTDTVLLQNYVWDGLNISLEWSII